MIEMKLNKRELSIENWHLSHFHKFIQEKWIERNFMFAENSETVLLFNKAQYYIATEWNQTKSYTYFPN